MTDPPPDGGGGGQDLVDLLRRVDLFADLDDDALEALRSGLRRHPLAGGDWLFHEGDHGSTFYLLLMGRVEVVKHGRVVATLTPGDTLGEVALLQGGRRSAGVRAVRDAELLALDRAGFVSLLARPTFAAGLLGRLSRRLAGSDPTTGPASGSARREAHTSICDRPMVAVAHTPGLGVHAALDALTLALARNARVRRVAGVSGEVTPASSVARMLDEAERDGEIVLFDAGHPGEAFADLCARQTDRRLLLCDRDGVAPDLDVSSWARCDVVTVGSRPLHLAALQALPTALEVLRWHRIRPGTLHDDASRLVRRITGRSVGVVLSGGGARGYAHVGVLRAMEEAGVVVDRWGGTSIGSLIAALAAVGHSSASITQLLREELRDRRPFADYTLPRHALISGRRATAMLRRVLPVPDVRQLATPWFGMSSSISTAQEVAHRSGPLWEAVAASMSLPGIAPPRRMAGHLLVDGAVLNNLPVDRMAADREGPVIAVDVGRRFSSVEARLPPLTETLMGTIGLSARQDIERRRAAATLLIEPEQDTRLLEWAALEEAMVAGYRAGTSALSESSRDTRRALGIG